MLNCPDIFIGNCRMARRKESGFDTLVALPWWAAVLVGLLGLVAFNVVAPLALHGQMLGGAISQSIKPFGYFWFGVCCLAARSFAISNRLL